LSAGARLGPYEILSPIGAGGMGEVYRAKDTRLDRTVAIKVLPEKLMPSAEARQRFEREAKTISQLSHPHICALYDVGREGETEYLVMELLEGETLAERLANGPLPLEQTLRHGADIADALDRAHRQGIVHRDLKPGNVMLTRAGVKLLDFGLARSFSVQPDSAAALTALPTVPPNLTQEGSILGTVQYMAPEQLEGKTSDARTDIFAFGALLYEMATGRKAFTGSSQASLISSIMKEDPAAISTISPMSPPSLDRVVRTCLAKDPDDRWQTARDVGLQLQGIRDDRSASQPAVLPAPGRRRRTALLPWLLAAASLVLAVFGWTHRPPPGRDLPVLRTYLPPPPNANFHTLGANVGGVALSPDGRRLAFGAHEADGMHRLWVRDLDLLEPYAVVGADEAIFPFWSPDSRSIGFFARGKLKVVEASPNPPAARELADVIEPRGASWGEDGTIVYAPQNYKGLMRVPAAGGTPTPATALDASTGETSHRWPYFLPGGKRLLYMARSPDPKSPIEVRNEIVVASLDGKERRVVIPAALGATRTVYTAPGFLLFRRGTNLMALAFDLDRLQTSGEPLLVAKDVQGFLATGLSIFSTTPELLVYSTRVSDSPSSLVLLDRSGKQLSTIMAGGMSINLALAANGKTVAVARVEEPFPPDLWLSDIGVAREIRLTRDAVPQVAPVFQPDGNRLFYSAISNGPWAIWEMSLPGGKDVKPFLESETTKTPTDASPDGRWLMYREYNAGTRGDLKYVALEGDRTPRTYIATADDETHAKFSPDGRWVAYVSDDSGRKEVYVAAFPDPARRFRVSTSGGMQPQWSHDGKELFYLQADQLMASSVAHKGDDLAFSQSQPLFKLLFYSRMNPGFDLVAPYAVTPDGNFVAFVRSSKEVTPPLVVVQNWQAGLKKP
jgi:Tol biopolymer transport system component/tRNA A-37 threonylcarbamoyl transferase component Bud32